MSRIEAWIASWDREGAAQYARHVSEFCGVETHIASLYDHEVNVLNMAILQCKSPYLWFLTPDVDLLYQDTAHLMLEWMEAQPHVGILCPNREGEPPNTGGSQPYDKYLADNTAILYRREVGALFDPDFIFTGWSDLDFGEEVKQRGFKVQVDPRVSVSKSFTAYGSWSAFRRAYNARNRLLLEAKWCWVGRDRWQGVDHYNLSIQAEKRIPTMFELAWWSEDRLNAFADSVNYEHPHILMAAGMGSGNEDWMMPANRHLRPLEGAAPAAPVQV